MDNDPELESLMTFYEDLDPSVVRRVWKKVGQDYKAAMEELGEIAKNPDAARRLGGPGLPDDGDLGASSSTYRPPISSPAPEALSDGGAEEPYRDAYARAPPPGAVQSADAYGSAWDMTNLLSDLGQGLSDGITGLADNISDFVTDLASAFDAGWDEEDEDTAGAQRRAADSAAVVTGGSDAQKVQSRRQPKLKKGSATRGAAERPAAYLDEDERKDD